MRQIWTTWKYTLGVSVTQEQKIMMIGLLSFAPVYLLVTAILTFIISGVIRHWNDITKSTT